LELFRMGVAVFDSLVCRTLIKKASYITIEDDGTVIVSDKNGDVFA
jgi:hypothetical protein